MALRRKISQLPECRDFHGLYTIGVDAQNRSVKVSLDYIQQVVEEMIAETEKTKQATKECIAATEECIATNELVKKNEQERIANETARKSAEEARVTAENLRDQAETARQTAEDQRAQAESLRAQAETLRAQAETERQDNETARQQAETLRAQAESLRDQAETLRAQAETLRDQAETERATAETARQTAETDRQTKETERQTNETARQTAETDRATAEKARAKAEADRVTEFARLKQESETATENAQDAADAAIHQPTVKNGTWWIWDTTAKDYVDTGYACNSDAYIYTPQVYDTLPDLSTLTTYTIGDKTHTFTIGNEIYVKDEEEANGYALYKRFPTTWVRIPLVTSGLAFFRLAAADTADAATEEPGVIEGQTTADYEYDSTTATVIDADGQPINYEDESGTILDE